MSERTEMALKVACIIRSTKEQKGDNLYFNLSTRSNVTVSISEQYGGHLADIRRQLKRVEILTRSGPNLQIHRGRNSWSRGSSPFAGQLTKENRE